MKTERFSNLRTDVLKIFKKAVDYLFYRKPPAKGDIILVKEHNLRSKSERLGKGEMACIEMCGNQDTLLIDDRDAKEEAHLQGKACFDLPTFLYACKKKGIIQPEAMKLIVQELKEKDYYEFKKDVESLLLK